MQHTHSLYFLRIVAAAIAMMLATLASADGLSVVGTGDGLDILRMVAEAYRKRNPGIELTVPDSIGSGGAIAAVGTNRERMGRVARPLTASEQASGIAYQPIIRIPTVFFVHPEAPVRQLTADQLRRIFSGEITSWRDVGGPDMRIRVVRREDADSSVQVFRAAFPAFRDIKFTDRAKLALTTQEAIAAVIDNPGAIGFGPYSAGLGARLGVIAVDGVAPTDAAYPANVILALIYKQDKFDPDLRRFAEFFRSEEVGRLVREYGARLIE